MILIRRLLLISLSLFLIKVSYCQQNIISATPEAAGFNQFINYPVSLNTGIPSISIPLYTINVNGISLPIELRYHASGIKVNQQSSWVGLGWDLSIEPQITRSINGKPDEESYLTNSHVGAWGSYYPRDAYYLNLLADGVVDEQPDEYSFNLLTGSGGFMYRKTSTNTSEISTIPFKPIKITSSGSFTIIDELGREYTFNKVEQTNPNIYNGSNSWATCWKCSKIISASKKDTIFFAYNDTRGISKYFANERTEIIDMVSDPTITAHRATINNYSYSSGYGGTLAGSNPGYPYSIGETNWGGPGTYILDVIEPTGIGFHYGYTFQGNNLANTHHDVMGISNTTSLTLNEVIFRGGKISIYSRTNNGVGSRIDSIKVFNDKGDIIKKIQFAMRYIHPDAVNQTYPTQSDFRMLLDSVIIYGAKSEREKYAFEYISNGPNDNWGHSFGKISDFWGYYQGGLSSDIYYGTSVPAFKDVNIIDPNAPEVFLSNYTASFGGAPATPYEPSMQIYTLKKMIFPTGGKTEFEYASNRYIDNGEIKIAGGLRIEKIKMYTDTNAVNTALEKIYKYGEDESGAGDIKLNPDYAVYSYSQSTHDAVGSSNITARKRTYLSNAVGDVFYQNGSAVNYRMVTEYQKDNGIFSGKTVYRYAPYDASSGVASYYNGSRIENTDITTHRIEINGGELLSTTKYVFKNNQYIWIEKDSNTYIKYVDTAKIYIGKVFRTKVYGSPSLFSTYGTIADFNYVSYAQEVGTMLLAKNILQSRSTDYLNNIISKTTNFYYDNAAHFQKTRIETENTDGSMETVLNTYPPDYSSGNSAIDNMKTNNLVLYPVERVRYLKRGDNTTILSGMLNWYNSAGNGLIDTIYTIETTGPVSLASFKFSSRTIGVVPPSGTATSLLKDESYKLKVINNNYDSRSNLLSITPQNNISTSYLWDYDQKYPIANVTNAVQSDIAYTSFEADGKGNWMYTYPDEPQVVGAVTGIRYLNVNSRDGNATISKDNLQSGKKYIVSYWSKVNTPFSIIGGTGSHILGRNVSGWHFHKHIVNATASTISVIANDDIDELRLYPLTAQMTTYTYEPLIGMTSQCDANNKITYYEYDSFGRLKTVRDQDKNVIKTMDYQYQQPNNQ
ncbi:hypothetical protein [Terrimonas sp.]|uniref:hypothetical protein n=1 Tax=Terrimonas sp. TaxID=1914338 RepID=UPI00105710FF|nr:hypothetical protein [Terrimonas sp.]